jgi:DNA-directed RNA polymerase subunit RPC12/RpoP
MDSRTIDSYQKHLTEFIKLDIYVVCPYCSKKAIVKPNNSSLKIEDIINTKVVCPFCGFSKMLLEKPTSIIFSSKSQKVIGRSYVIGAPIDPFFQLPLWLSSDFEGNILWAYNYEHLSFIRGHVEAKLRERNVQEIFNTSLGSRLPKWMTSKKNREMVLKKITTLEVK